jgi:hypothetical protein
MTLQDERQPRTVWKWCPPMIVFLDQLPHPLLWFLQGVGDPDRTSTFFFESVDATPGGMGPGTFVGWSRCNVYRRPAKIISAENWLTVRSTYTMILLNYSDSATDYFILTSPPTLWSLFDRTLLHGRLRVRPEKISTLYPIVHQGLFNSSLPWCSLPTQSWKKWASI